MSAPASSAAPATITAGRLQLLSPHCDYVHIAPQLDAAAKAHGIATPRQVRHWLAQAYVESEGFLVLEEDLDYTVEDLCRTWPSRFSSPAAAKPYAGKPEALACHVYAGRNGNAAPLDGWTYRGRGYFQVTGRANYIAAGKRLAQPYDTDPQLVATAAGAAATAADFWRCHALNQVLAAHADETAAAAAIRRVINGGETGLPAVLKQLARAATIWRG